MTIDERIEALTQSLELLASLHRDLEESTAKGFAEMRAKSAETDEKMAQLAETMKHLSTVVLAHQERPDRIEGK